MKKYAFLLCLLICLVVVGCGKNKRLVGKVTFTDGTPAPSGMVVFRKDNFMARGEIQPNGSYKMSSEGNNDGLPPGEYKVYIQGMAAMPASAPTNPRLTTQMVLPVLLCDPKYTDPDTSGLTCTVPAPRNRFDIVLEPNPKNSP